MLADQCIALGDRLDALTAEIDALRDDQPAFDFGPEGQLRVSTLDGAPLEVRNSTGPGSTLSTSITNPTEAADNGPVVAAIESAGDTSHRDIWGLAGILAGIASVIAIYRLVRP